MERTLIIFKPDAVQRGLCGQILTRFENKGLQIAGLKFMKIPRETAETHYAPHKGKGFYEGLVNADATEIDGRWRLPGTMESGTFLMVRSGKRAEAIVAEQRAKEPVR